MKTDEKVISNDVVLAFADGENYLIPDRDLGEWVKTNPEIHAQLATAANAAYDGRWKALVRMIKKWNDSHDRPVKPSFLLEVMALGILNRGFGGHYSLELQTFFATAAERITDTWKTQRISGRRSATGLPATPRSSGGRQQLAAAAEDVVEGAAAREQGKNGDALRTGARTSSGRCSRCPKLMA